MEFFHRATNFPFMSTRRVWYALSALMILVSLGSLLLRGLNLGVDFTGGVTVQASFPDNANRDAVDTALKRAGYAEPQVTIFGRASDMAIRLPPTKLSTEAVRTQLGQILHGVDAKVQIQQVDVIYPQVGGELLRSAWQGMIATLLAIGAYIILRFHTWRLSFGAILAVLHDPILVFGVFSLTHTPFDLTVVAAMLAVIGYSLNDTVVVFDRIRERFHVARRLDPVMVLDQSINQTLSRTIMTKVVTLIVVVALYALGGPVLRGFSEALIIGILAGTYSSIYISSAVALDCGLKAEHVLPPPPRRQADDTP
ncbi:MAG TPA: protein translocase subunit SecF [Steroidobacteraceae bacterium]|nr:protein translocase subunit SecF [Steroidobacteraceae bacterium]